MANENVNENVTQTQKAEGRRDFYAFCYGRHEVSDATKGEMMRHMYGDGKKEGAEKHVEAPAPSASEQRSASMMSIYGFKA